MTRTAKLTDAEGRPFSLSWRLCDSALLIATRELPGVPLHTLSVEPYAVIPPNFEARIYWKTLISAKEHFEDVQAAMRRLVQ